MIWYIIGRDMHVLCTASTDLLKSLPIDDSSGGQTIAITNNCAIGTYDFTVDPRHPDAVYVTEGNYIAFRDKYGKDRLYTIMAVEGDDSWDVHCEDIGIDLINETAVPWDYTGNPKTIADTLAPVLLDSGWEIGVNEVAGYQRATKYEGTTDSQLTRIGDVCNVFDSECEFAIEMKGAKVTKQVINIYKTLGQDMTQQRFVDGINLLPVSAVMEKRWMESGRISLPSSMMTGIFTAPRETSGFTAGKPEKNGPDSAPGTTKGRASLTATSTARLSMIPTARRSCLTAAWQS